MIGEIGVFCSNAEFNFCIGFTKLQINQFHSFGINNNKKF